MCIWLEGKICVSQSLLCCQIKHMPSVCLIQCSQSKDISEYGSNASTSSFKALALHQSGIFGQLQQLLVGLFDAKLVGVGNCQSAIKLIYRLNFTGSRLCFVEQLYGCRYRGQMSSLECMCIISVAIERGGHVAVVEDVGRHQLLELFQQQLFSGIFELITVSVL